jgi:hypothetical protein
MVFRKSGTGNSGTVEQWKSGKGTVEKWNSRKQE